MPAGTVRYPRFLVSVAGASLNPLQCAVALVNRDASSTMSAMFALDAPGSPSASFWSDTAPMSVSVSAMGSQLFTGNVDKVGIDFIDRAVHISGRDNSAKLHDMKTTETFANKTPQAIIQELAGKAGLGVQFKGQGSAKAGQKYKDDYNLLTDYDSAWNVIVGLARRLGCVVSSNGNTLFVTPIAQASGGGSFTVTYQAPTVSSPEHANMFEIRADRNVHLAKTVEVTADSWKFKEGEKATATATASGEGGTIELKLNHPDQTQEQLQETAKGHANEVIGREMEISVRGPGDPSVTAQGMLTVQGTQSGFDGTYFIANVTHNFSWRDGYTMHISGRTNKDGRSAS